MLGLSIQKIGVFLAILGVLWTAYRLYRRYEQSQQQVAKRQAAQPPAAVAELQPCPRCGTYVANLAAHRCQPTDAKRT